MEVFQTVIEKIGVIVQRQSSLEAIFLGILGPISGGQSGNGRGGSACRSIESW